MLRSIRDWTADEPGPDGGRAGRLKRARRLDATLNAFVALREPAPLPDGPLTGVPYAAKDIFAKHKNLTTWWTKVSQRPAWRKTLDKS